MCGPLLPGSLTPYPAPEPVVRARPAHGPGLPVTFPEESFLAYSCAMVPFAGTETSLLRTGQPDEDTFTAFAGSRRPARDRADHVLPPPVTAAEAAPPSITSGQVPSARPVVYVQVPAPEPLCSVSWSVTSVSESASVTGPRLLPKLDRLAMSSWNCDHITVGGTGVGRGRLLGRRRGQIAEGRRDGDQRPGDPSSSYGHRDAAPLRIRSARPRGAGPTRVERGTAEGGASIRELEVLTTSC